MDRAAAECVVLSRGWLAEQAPAFRGALLARAELVTFRKGDIVFQAGDPPGGLYGVAEGSFGVYVVTPHTGPDLSLLLHPGWWYGEGPTLGSASRNATVRAMEPSAALHLPLDLARSLVRSDPEAARSVGLLGQASMRLAIANIADLMIRRADRRVGAVLLRASGALEDSVLRRTGEICLTQTQLAQMANASRDLVNRTLGQFEAAGWVRLGYNRIAITAPEPLAEFAFGRR